jgi:hypothetical protein
MTDRANYQGVFGHNIGVPPDDRPKLIAFKDVSLAAGETRRFDLKELIGQSVIDTLQSIYVDNDNASRLIITPGASQMRIIVQPYSQGWFPIPLPNNEGLTLYSVGAVVMSFALANVNIIAGPWKTQ